MINKKVQFKQCRFAKQVCLLLVLCAASFAQASVIAFNPVSVNQYEGGNQYIQLTQSGVVVTTAEPTSGPYSKVAVIDGLIATFVYDGTDGATPNNWTVDSSDGTMIDADAVFVGDNGLVGTQGGHVTGHQRVGFYFDEGNGDSRYGWADFAITSHQLGAGDTYVQSTIWMCYEGDLNVGIEVGAVPEPVSVAFMGSGMVILGFLRRFFR
ncbi:hypothetical protein ACFLQY_01215 [Verrucomicrobiota bacterium]